MDAVKEFIENALMKEKEGVERAGQRFTGLALRAQIDAQRLQEQWLQEQWRDRAVGGIAPVSSVRWEMLDLMDLSSKTRIHLPGGCRPEA